MAEKKTHEYLMGYDCGLNGPNTTNCHFTLFSTPEKTRQWEEGKKNGENKKFRNNQKSKAMNTYIYSPDRLLRVPVMEKPQFSSWDFMSPAMSQRIESETAAYNLWLNDDKINPLIPEEHRGYFADKYKEGDELVEGRDFETKKQILVVENDEDVWMTLNAFPSMYDEMTDECRRVVALPITEQSKDDYEADGIALIKPICDAPFDVQLFNHQ